MLYGCLATYEVCERIGVRSWKHISTSHIRLVLPLAHEMQVKLLRSAEAQRWPVKHLEQEVETLRPERRPGERQDSCRRKFILKAPIRRGAEAA